MDEASTTIIALLAEDIDKDAKPFGTYDVVKSKVDMDLKTASVMKRKEKLVRKIKKKFGEGIEGVVEEEEEDESEEEEQGQGPMELTQGLEEDKEEGAKEEEAKEVPT